jgi:hypothetical protein
MTFSDSFIDFGATTRAGPNEIGLNFIIECSTGPLTLIDHNMRIFIDKTFVTQE